MKKKAKINKSIKLTIKGMEIKIPAWLIAAVCVVIASVTGIQITIEDDNEANNGTNQVVNVSNPTNVPSTNTVVTPPVVTPPVVTPPVVNVPSTNVNDITENPVQPEKPNKPWWMFWKK